MTRSRLGRVVVVRAAGGGCGRRCRRRARRTSSTTVRLGVAERAGRQRHRDGGGAPADAEDGRAGRRRPGRAGGVPSADRCSGRPCGSRRAVVEGRATDGAGRGDGGRHHGLAEAYRRSSSPQEVRSARCRPASVGPVRATGRVIAGRADRRHRVGEVDGVGPAGRAGRGRDRRRRHRPRGAGARPPGVRRRSSSASGRASCCADGTPRPPGGGRHRVHRRRRAEGPQRDRPPGGRRRDRRAGWRRRPRPTTW